MKVQLRPRESRATAGNKFRLRMGLFLNRLAGIPMRASFAPQTTDRTRYAKMHAITATPYALARRLIADEQKLTHIEMNTILLSLS